MHVHGKEKDTSRRKEPTLLLLFLEKKGKMKQAPSSLSTSYYGPRQVVTPFPQATVSLSDGLYCSALVGIPFPLLFLRLPVPFYSFFWNKPLKSPHIIKQILYFTLHALFIHRR
jgi:hypothetical protein